MARLPDSTALGPIGSPLSGRPIASYDVTGYARGAAAEAQAFKDLGTGLASAGRDVSLVANQQRKDTDELEVAKAESEYLVNSKKLRDDLGNETDGTGLKEKYSPLFTGARDNAAKLISNPRLREVWTLKRSPDVEDSIIQADTRSFNIAKDKEVAGVSSKLDELRQAALNETDPAKRSGYVQTGQGLIRGLEDAGFLDRTRGQLWSKKWTEDYAIGWAEMQPAAERERLLRPRTSMEQFVERTVGAESDGDALARNPRSTAFGAGQFIEKTWLSLIKEARPQWASRPDDELLALRADKALSKEMVALYAKKNAEYLAGQGIEANPGTLYLAHFLGPEGAAKVLKAAPDTPVAGLLSADAIRANPSILQGKTAGTVAGWAADKMGGAGSSGTPVDFIPSDRRALMWRQAQGEVTRGQVMQSAARSEELERNILDAGAGKATLLPRSTIENDPLLDEARRNALLRQYDAAQGDVAGLNKFMDRMYSSDPGISAASGTPAPEFNPYDKDQQKYADAAFQRLGGDYNALRVVVDKTRMLPKSAGSMIRSDLASTNPERVVRSMTLAANLLARNPNIFIGIDGQSDLENNAVAFRHYVDGLGMTADEAAKKIITDQSPEYQAKVKARLKNEDVDGKIKKELSLSDLEGSFDPSWGWMRNPKVAFEPKQRIEMFTQYAELVRDRYMTHGDWSLAKSQAADQLKKVWGVSNIDGSAGLTGGGVVMQYRPEGAPAYSMLEDPAALLANQAIKDIKERYGETVERKDLRLTAIPGVTGPAYKEGRPVPYMLTWTDKNKLVQTPMADIAWVADPAALLKMQTEEQRGGLRTLQEEAKPILDRRVKTRANAAKLRGEAGARIKADRDAAEIAD